MIIVYAIINPQGKMEQLSVMDSPDPALNEIVLKSLSKWSFRPAQLEGQPVPIKMLMGIPLALPE
jgi:TonB family protein